MRINGRRMLMGAEMDDLEWRNVKQCYLGEVAYGVKVLPRTIYEDWWSGYTGSWGVVTVRTTPSLHDKCVWEDGHNNYLYLGTDLTDSPYLVKQDDGTYLFTPTLYRAGKINYSSAAVNEYYIVRKSEPIKHK